MSHCHIKNATPQRFDHYKGILFHLWTALRSLTKRIQLPKIKYKMNEMGKKITESIKGRTAFKLIQLNM